MTAQPTNNHVNPPEAKPSGAQNAPAPQQTPYELIGGEAGVRQLTDRFYDIMDTSPGARRIRAMHGNDLSPIRQLLFEFLSGWLGGPSLYFSRPEHRCIMSAHRPFAIGKAERDEWMLCMRTALAESTLPPEIRALVDQGFLRMADSFRK